jgi:glycine cleavage system protein P-like pyridoxal-binding family
MVSGNYIKAKVAGYFHLYINGKNPSLFHEAIVNSILNPKVKH